MASRVRLEAGALVHDWPRFASSLFGGRETWARMRNRADAVTVDAATGGVRCEWLYTRELHLCRLHPRTGRWLLRRGLSEWPIAFADAPPQAEGAPEVSFVIGHRGEARLPHLLKTLETIAGQRDVSIECIVVEQSAEALAGPLLPSWVRHIHTPVAAESPYNRSATLNAGAAAARGDVVILHDNDFLVPSSYAAAALGRAREGFDFIDLKRFMFYMPSEASEAIRAGDSPANFDPERVIENLRGGSIAVRRSAYFAIGGSDESFVGWGGEDDEFWERAEAAGKTWTFGTLPFVHLWHAPQPEKAAAQAAFGSARFRQIMATPPRIRIERLLEAKEDGSRGVV